MASYRGKFFGGYSGTYWRSDGRHIDSMSEAVGGIAKQIPNLQGVEFRTGNYKNLLIPDESIIYCDPPIYGYRRIFRRYKPR